jgi:hypothetical protein
MGKAKGHVVSAAELGGRASALSLAVLAGADELDPAQKNDARRVLDRVHERLNISGDHTVVALAGATGSGKSSLFNALIGADVAEIGARRPTTSKPTAAVWGDTDASELLDWLDVKARHVVGLGRKAVRPISWLGRLTGSCCSTCPTSTRAPSITDARPSACSSSSTCSCG